MKDGGRFCLLTTYCLFCFLAAGGCSYFPLPSQKQIEFAATSSGAATAIATQTRSNSQVKIYRYHQPVLSAPLFSLCVRSFVFCILGGITPAAAAASVPSCHPRPRHGAPIALAPGAAARMCSRDTDTRRRTQCLPNQSPHSPSQTTSTDSPRAAHFCSLHLSQTGDAKLHTPGGGHCTGDG
jgi:hypothetical protein